MNYLIEKIKASRLTTISIENFIFTIRRPTDYEATKAVGKSQEDFFRQFVTDWHGVQEIHLVAGGTSVDVPFESDLFLEWIADQPQLWEPLMQGIIDSYKQHDKRRSDSEKKPEIG